MQITIHNTTQIIELNGVPARVWEGCTDSGIAVHCFITRIAVSNNNDQAEFVQELQECSVPSAAIQSFPLKMIL